MKHIRIAFFGGEPLGVPVLAELHDCGITPDLIVCNPDRPVGRKQILTHPPVKAWADEQNIPTFQPEKLKNETDAQPLIAGNFDLFVVVAYNKILPKWLIEIPKHKTLNVHPSLLPAFRGASPIRSAILNDVQDTGVTIMLLDEKMDHGPIVNQEYVHIADEHWPIRGTELDNALARVGGALLAATIPEWTAGTIVPQEQDHTAATYCGKIQKADGELTINPHALPVGQRAYEALLAIRAYDGYPGTFFYIATDTGNKRVKIVDADIAQDTLVIHRVIPEGKKEMDWETFLHTLA